MLHLYMIISIVTVSEKRPPSEWSETGAEVQILFAPRIFFL